jgi:hypothetical protein
MVGLFSDIDLLLEFVFACSRRAGNLAARHRRRQALLSTKEDFLLAARLLAARGLFKIGFPKPIRGARARPFC